MALFLKAAADHCWPQVKAHGGHLSLSLCYRRLAPPSTTGVAGCHRVCVCVCMCVCVSLVIIMRRVGEHCVPSVKARGRTPCLYREGPQRRPEELSQREAHGSHPGYTAKHTQCHVPSPTNHRLLRHTMRRLGVTVPADIAPPLAPSSLRPLDAAPYLSECRTVLRNTVPYLQAGGPRA